MLELALQQPDAAKKLLVSDTTILYFDQETSKVVSVYAGRCVEKSLSKEERVGMKILQHSRIAAY